MTARSDRSRALVGDVAVPSDLSLKPHKWSSDWLNHQNGEQTCSVCGVTLLAEGAVVRADMIPGGNHRIYNYIDCLGRPLSSMMELSCPTFAGVGSNGASVSVEAKEIARLARVESAKAEQKLSALDARVVQLEAANAALQQQIAAATQIDVRQLAVALMELAEKAKADKALESIEMRGQHVLVPKELVEVIDVVAVREDEEAKEG